MLINFETRILFVFQGSKEKKISVALCPTGVEGNAYKEEVEGSVTNRHSRGKTTDINTSTNFQHTNNSLFIQADHHFEFKFSAKMVFHL